MRPSDLDVLIDAAYFNIECVWFLVAPPLPSFSPHMVHTITRSLSTIIPIDASRFITDNKTCCKLDISSKEVIWKVAKFQEPCHVI